MTGRREDPGAAIGLGAPTGIPVGISACLLGSAVRFDGGHKRDRNLTDLLGRHFHWVPVCPEVEIGLGTPRESLRLIGSAEAPRLVAPRSGRDLTEVMAGHAVQRVEELAGRGLRGFILKKDSPSCGLYRVRVYDGAGVPARDGSGLFARTLRERLPNLPVEEEGRLQDPSLRENFFERVFAYRRMQGSSRRAGEPRSSSRSTPRRIAAPGARPQGLSRARTTRRIRQVAHAGRARRSIRRALHRALETKGDSRTPRDVLEHMLGHFTDALTPGVARS